ncbi:MAG: biopolymer transporter ExbD, partial [Zoogloea sp.]|nr:biopolymer transporter ExbD [Zoogloea sp.]
TQPSEQQANEIQVAVTAPGEVLVNKRPVAVQDVSGISAALRAVVPPGSKDPVVIINADAKAEHQRVIDVMQAAQQAGLSRIAFATQTVQK